MIIESVWCAIATAGLVRCIYLLREATIDRRVQYSRGYKNGRMLLADWQVEHSRLGVLIYFFLLAPGLMALAHGLGMTSLKERLFIVPFLMVAALTLMVVRQERSAYYRRRQLREM